MSGGGEMGFSTEGGSHFHTFPYISLYKMTKNGTVHNSGLNEANHFKLSENDCMGEEDIF